MLPRVYLEFCFDMRYFGEQTTFIYVKQNNYNLLVKNPYELVIIGCRRLSTL